MALASFLDENSMSFQDCPLVAMGMERQEKL
jgi:hypothetical protein